MNDSLRRVTQSAGLLLLGLLACTALAAGSDRAALEAAIEHWMTAVNAQDVATLTRTMTEDVELSDDTTTATGRDAAIRALLEVTPGRLVATTREITIANGIAWHVAGLARIQKNADVQARGQALEIWKRVNGEWRLHRRMAAGIGTLGDSITRPSTNEPVLDRPGK